MELLIALLESVGWLFLELCREIIAQIIIQLIADAIAHVIGVLSNTRPIPPTSRIPARLLIVDVLVWSAFLLGSAAILSHTIAMNRTDAAHAGRRLTLAMVICGSMGWFASSTRNRASTRLGRTQYRRPGRD